MRDVILYGMPASLYSGKPRAYLRKQRIAYREVPMGSQNFRERIVPQIGRFIAPVIEMPDGRIVQDGTAIIDFFEDMGEARYSAYPSTPRQRIGALIFELFGGEGLLRPAMYYRWNFPNENERFLRVEFGRFLAPGQPSDAQDAVYAFASGRMKQAAEIFGVTPLSHAAIEESYAEFLALFDAHCAAMPYLFGGQPSIGDYGLLAPLYAHLGRDPKPADLMRRHAPCVARFVERMNAPDLDMLEFEALNPGFLEKDAIPATLSPLFGFIAREFLPEISAQAAFIDAWLSTNPETREGDAVGGNPSKRVLGRTTFAWRGLELSIGVFPYRLWLLQRIQDAFDALSPLEAASVRAWLKQEGLEPILDLRIRRRIERRDNREVWGAEG